MSRHGWLRGESRERLEEQEAHKSRESKDHRHEYLVSRPGVQGTGPGKTNELERGQALAELEVDIER